MNHQEGIAAFKEGSEGEVNIGDDLEIEGGRG